MATMLIQNFRFALRLLRKSPGFTLVAILTLALGIGATTAIFSVVYATMLAPLPYPNPDQLVLVWSHRRGNDNDVSPQDYFDWKAQNTTFQSMIAWNAGSFNLATADRPEQVRGMIVGPGWYSMIGVKFFKGRDFVPEESQPGKDKEVILTHDTWQQMGSDPNIIGKSIRIDLEPHTVVGVLAPGAPDRMQIKFLVPMAFTPDQVNREDRHLIIAARLKPGVTITQAQADMNVIGARLASEYPADKDFGINVVPLRNYWFPRRTQSTLWALLGTVGFVLLIACANVANLLLAKATTRLKEVAVRASLGATRARVFMQVLSESLVLALLGGLAGVGVAELMLQTIMKTLLSGMGLSLPSEAEVGLSLPVLGFTLLCTMLCGVFFGCAPAWRASGLNVNETLKEAGRAGASSAHQHVRRVLVVSEFALALALLAGAGLAIRSFWNLSRLDMGVRTDHILTFEISRPTKDFTQSPQILPFYRELLERLHAIPGVTYTSAASGTPVNGGGFGLSFNVVGQPVKDGSSPNRAVFMLATPEYYKTFGIRLVKGRMFTEADNENSPRVALISEFMASHFFPGVDPIGQRLSVPRLIPGVNKPGPQQEWEIVGVFHDVRMEGPRSDSFPEIDVPFYQSPWPQEDVALRTSGDPESIRKSAGAVVTSIDPDLPIAQVQTMDQIVDTTFLEDRTQTVLFGILATVALLLSAIGIYGVMAFSVAQRTHEIGLRMALGADRNQVLRLVLKEGIVLAVVGLGLGLVGAMFVGRAVKSMLFGVGTIDFAAFSIVSLLLLGSALLACYFPAQRATRVDPMVALRYE
jgi:putative ABC transport system permease protein